MSGSISPQPPSDPYRDLMARAQQQQAMISRLQQTPQMQTQPFATQSVGMPSAQFDPLVVPPNSALGPMTRSQIGQGAQTAMGATLGMMGTTNPKFMPKPTTEAVREAFEKRAGRQGWLNENFFESPEYKQGKADYQHMLDHIIPIEQTQWVLDSWKHELGQPDVAPRREQQLLRMIQRNQEKLKDYTQKAIAARVDPSWARRTFKPEDTLADLFKAVRHEPPPESGAK